VSSNALIVNRSECERCGFYVVASNPIQYGDCVPYPSLPDGWTSLHFGPVAPGTESKGRKAPSLMSTDATLGSNVHMILCELCVVGLITWINE